MSNTVKTNLKNLSVLITRPLHQAQILAEKIKVFAGHPILFPAIAIAPIDNPKEIDYWITRLDQFDIAIFVSANAVYHTYNSIYALWFMLPDTLKIAAMGKSTKQALLDYKFPVDIMPQHDFSSEGLLALPEFKDSIQGKKIIIFSGVGGSDLLEKTLQKRGAEVQKVETYKRVLPTADSAMLDREIKTHGLQITVATSVESLTNLFIMISQTQKETILNSHLIVMSERIAKAARELGFHDIVVTHEASDTAIIDAILARKEKA